MAKYLFEACADVSRRMSAFDEQRDAERRALNAQTVEVSVAGLLGSPDRVASDLRALASKVERGERFQTTAGACVVSIGPPGTWATPVSDADLAREFFRRFAPIQVHLGAWRGPAAVAELEDDGSWISEALPDGSGREEYAAGEGGFVAALERARELVRGR